MTNLKKATVVTHRWLSLVLGLALVVVTTSGAFLLYQPEWNRWTHASAYDGTPSDDPLDMAEAIAVVDDAHPEFEPGSANVYGGVIEVLSADGEAHPGSYTVDPGTGEITGFVDAGHGFMGLMAQVHECFFTCADYPAHLSFLEHPMPTLGLAWLKDMQVGGFILGVTGLLLVFLAVSGIWLWWPSLRKFATGFRVRLRGGRYRRDYDLHQVIGIVAVPFLLVWGVTGASFEFHWVSTAWYSATGGEQRAEPTFASDEVDADTPDITPAEALAAAQRIAGPDAVPKNLFGPGADDPTGYYDVYFSAGWDPIAYSAYPGLFDVSIDRHDATHTQVVDYGTGPTLSNRAFDVWGADLGHYGSSVNGWWRIVWFLFGMTPLPLAVTGLSTWLYKRKVRKRRRRADPGSTADADAEPLDAEPVPLPVA